MDESVAEAMKRGKNQDVRRCLWNLAVAARRRQQIIDEPGLDDRMEKFERIKEEFSQHLRTAEVLLGIDKEAAPID